MSSTAVPKQPLNTHLTRFGVFYSLVIMIVIRQAFRVLTHAPGPWLTLARELCMFASAGVLLWFIRSGERRPLRSIGFNTAPVWKSLLWGVSLAIVCLAVAVGLSALTHYGQGEASKAFARLPLWVMFITVVRAGIVEELFYRGYAITRLRELGAGKSLSWALPLVIFATAHWTGGLANILIALVIGGIMTAFYLWRNDLTANIFGHFLVDFVGNILPALFGAG